MSPVGNVPVDHPFGIDVPSSLCLLFYYHTLQRRRDTSEEECHSTSREAHQRSFQVTIGGTGTCERQTCRILQVILRPVTTATNMTADHKALRGELSRTVLGERTKSFVIIHDDARSACSGEGVQLYLCLFYSYADKCYCVDTNRHYFSNFHLLYFIITAIVDGSVSSREAGQREPYCTRKRQAKH
jgi:hypothetical protein